MSASVKEKPKKVNEEKGLKTPSPSNLKEGTAAPYVSLFDSNYLPIRNALTGIPLGAYMSKFSYRYDQETENVCEVTLNTGNPETADLKEIAEGAMVNVQYGYIYYDGTHKSSKVHSLKVKELDCTFDDQGTHITLRLKDAASDLRTAPPYKSNGDEENTFKTFLDNGMGLDRGIIIERFEQIGSEDK